MRTLNHCTAIILVAFFTFASCKKTSSPPATPPVANAGASQTITLPTDSVTLTGLGTTSSGKIVGYIWSQVSGPAASTIVDPGASSTLVTNLAKGTYLFQLKVIDNNGLSGVDTVSVIVNPSPVQTVTLNPSNNPNEYNVVLYSGSSITTSSGSPEIPVEAWSSGGDLTIRELIKFDLSSIPANATIVSANLYLYSDSVPLNGNLVDANYGSNNAMLVQQVVADWSGTGLSWANQPGGNTTTQIVVPSTTSPSLDLNINVTSLVSSMVNNNANYGFKLLLQNEVEYTSRIFCSSYYPDATRHPALVIVYNPN